LRSDITGAVSLNAAACCGSLRQCDRATSSQLHVTIVGGGPSGLFTAWYLAAKLGPACRITILEASGRLGGKIMTGNIAGVGLYEAGVAEIYDYSAHGPDPLRDLIEKDLGLKVRHIKPSGCILDGHILPDIEALADHFGGATYHAAAAFKRGCAGLLKPWNYYQSSRSADNAHPWAQMSGEDVLATQIGDDVARRYTRIMCHSDVAAPPHQTTGLNLLKNVLMDVDGYLDLYSVAGGNEQIVHRLSAQLDAEIRLNTRACSVAPGDGAAIRLIAVTNGRVEAINSDFVVLAVPLAALSIIDWRSGPLRRAMFNHIGYFDRPGHYLRATLVFEHPFWREHFDGAWFMLDAFDGCALYDEGARHDVGSWGVLGFLIAGNAALELANLPDERIEEMCLDVLPAQFAQARSLLVDRRVHRWMAAVNAIPGGALVRDRLVNHRPVESLPQILVVGDYMFDSTLNGALDSAEVASDVIVADIVMRRRIAGNGIAVVRVDAAGAASEAALAPFFGGPFLAQMLKVVWGLGPGAKVLGIGSESAIAVVALGDLGFDVCVIDIDQLGRKPGGLPFAEHHFDAVVEIGLCRLPRTAIVPAIAELARVARCGVMLGSVVSDLPVEMIECHDLLAGVETFASRWDWSEEFLAQGFGHALVDPDRLAEAWRCAQAYGAGPGSWYEDSEGLLYCFYSVECVQARDRRANPPGGEPDALGARKLPEVWQELVAAPRDALHE
jgi:monoamine oxidase